MDLENERETDSIEEEEDDEEDIDRSADIQKRKRPSIMIGQSICSGCKERISGNFIYDDDNETWHYECFQMRRELDNSDFDTENPFQEIEKIVEYWRNLYFKKNDECSFFEEKKKELQTKYDDLVKTIQDKSSSSDQSPGHEANSTLETMAKQNQTAMLEISQLERIKSELTEENQELRKNLSTVVELSNSLERELNQKNEIEDKLKEEINALKSKLEESHVVFSEKMKEASEETEALKKEVKELSNKAKISRKASIDPEEKKKEDLIQEMQTKMELLFNLHETEKKKIKELEIRYDEMEKKAQELEKENKSLLAPNPSMARSPSIDTLSLSELQQKYLDLKRNYEQHISNIKGKQLERSTSKKKSDSPDVGKRSKKLLEMQAAIVKEGQVQQRTVINFEGKKVKKDWKPAWAVLNNNHLEIYPTKESKLEEICLEKIRIDLSGATVEYEKDTKKKKGQVEAVIKIATETTGTFQLEVPAEEADDWMKALKQGTVSSNSSSNLEELLAARKSHCIPHRFKEAFFTLHPAKCRVCGSNIHARGFKCIHCEFPCHEKCSTKVPPNCGISDLSRATIKRDKLSPKDNSLLKISPSSITLKRNQTSELNMSNDVFGMPLADIPGGDEDIPHVVTLCIGAIERKGLESEGIYRVPGIKGEIEKLKMHFSYGRPNLDDELWSDINVIGGALKLYFRMMPGSLLTEQLFHEFIDAVQAQSPQEKMKSMKEALSKLPKRNFNILKVVIVHLRKVADHGSMNKMHGPNLAAVFGPTLMKSPKEDDFAAINEQVSVIEYLIENIDQCFNISYKDK